MTTTADILATLDACDEPFTWAAAYPDPRDAWDHCPRGDWLLWVAVKLGVDHRLVVLAACDCARTALRHVPPGEDRPRLAIETAEAWCRGEVTDREVRAETADYAANAAWAAAWAATHAIHAWAATTAAHVAAGATTATTHATYATYADAARAAAAADAAAAANAACAAAATYSARCAAAATYSAYSGLVAADAAAAATADAAHAAYAIRAGRAIRAAGPGNPDAILAPRRRCAGLVRARIPWAAVAAGLSASRHRRL
jgi:hypothetical protein